MLTSVPTPWVTALATSSLNVYCVHGSPEWFLFAFTPQMIIPEGPRYKDRPSADYTLIDFHVPVRNLAAINEDIIIQYTSSPNHAPVIPKWARIPSR